MCRPFVEVAGPGRGTGHLGPRCISHEGVPGDLSTAAAASHIDGARWPPGAAGRAGPRLPGTCPAAVFSKNYPSRTQNHPQRCNACSCERAASACASRICSPVALVQSPWLQLWICEAQGDGANRSPSRLIMLISRPYSRAIGCSEAAPDFAAAKSIQCSLVVDAACEVHIPQYSAPETVFIARLPGWC